MRQLSRKEWPYQKELEHSDKMKWLQEYMQGRRRGDDWHCIDIWDDAFHQVNYIYCFKREDDYIMFLLSCA